MTSNLEIALSKLFAAEGRKLLFHHIDSDGICSAALILKFFHSFTFRGREGPVLDKKTMKYIESKKPNVVAWIDIPIDQEWKKLLALKEKLPETKFVIIDHHIITANMNYYGMIHINPRLRKRDAYIPTSYVVYKILEKMKCDVKPYKWIACAGIIGDYGKCMMEREIMKHGKRVSDLITSAIVLKSVKGSEKALKLLLRSETPYDFSTSELEKWHKIFVKEKNRIIADFETKKEIYGDFIFYEIKSRMNLTSTISSVISERYPRNVIIIRKKSGDFWKISLRCQSGKLNVGEIARKASEGIGSGGGHEKSSGAVVNDWETFKKRVLLFGS